MNARCKFLSVILAAASCTPVLAAFSPETAFFPYEQGWLGADAAYSIPLDRTSTLWLLGDTFTGKHRKPRTMIHNSIALRRCQAQGCEFTYWWSGMHSRHADSFFKTSESNYFWPLDGFVYQQKLYIFLEQMHETGKGGAFGFDYSKIVLATVADFTAPPDRWNISYQTVSIGNHVVPGVAVVNPDHLDSSYVYIFTLFRASSSKPFVGLLRLPLADLPLADRSTHWQYLSLSKNWNTWARSSSPADALKLLDGNITEMTVKYHPLDHRWLAVYPTPGFLSNTASFSVSQDLLGPWSAAHPLFRYPEMKKDDPRYTPHVFCYAAKEHPEMEAGSRIALTYACNSTKESEILKDLRLYRPQLVDVELPFQSSGSLLPPAR